MLVLALDTSSAAVSAAVVDVATDALQVRGEAVAHNARGHGELLAGLVDSSLRQAGVAPSRLRAVVAGTGPGPFTGLRVGLVTAAVVADVLGIPSYGVCSLDAIAGALPPQPTLLVVTDARRREVYWARYEDGARVAGPHVSKPAAVPLEGITAVAGAGYHLYPDVFSSPWCGPEHPSLAALVGYAADRVRSGAPTEVLTPLYLRRPDAVEPVFVAAAAAQRTGPT